MNIQDIIYHTINTDVAIQTSHIELCKVPLWPLIFLFLEAYTVRNIQLLKEQIRKLQN